MNIAEKAAATLHQLLGIRRNNREEASAMPSRSTDSNARQDSHELSESTKRQCELVKLYFIDYYTDQMTYLSKRQERLERFKEIQCDVKEIERQRQYKVFCGKERMALRKRRARLRASDFNIIRQIGQGGYGSVFLCQKKDTLEICAIKKMNKELLQRLGETKHILTERDILSRTDSPWLVHLFYAFQDTSFVYLAMEFVPGGDFRTLLNASGVLHENHARFYLAEMLCSVFSLHKLGYIHRDLKPENFLLDAQGHIKLTDFGLCKGRLSSEIVGMLQQKLEAVRNQNFNVRTVSERYNTFQTMKKETRAFSLVGSPDYMAYEVLTKAENGYDEAVDYWSIGCIMFEALSGYPPFFAPSTDAVWVNLYNWQKVLERPVYEGEDEEFNLSDTAWDLITKLIAEREFRFCQRSQVENHPFFNVMDFKRLREIGRYEIPLVPRLASSTDCSYFDDFANPQDMALYNEIRKKEEDYKNSKSGPTQVEQSAFVGFTFKHKLV